MTSATILPMKQVPAAKFKAHACHSAAPLDLPFPPDLVANIGRTLAEGLLALSP